MSSYCGKCPRLRTYSGVWYCQNDLPMPPNTFTRLDSDRYGALRYKTCRVTPHPEDPRYCGACPYWSASFCSLYQSEVQASSDPRGPVRATKCCSANTVANATKTTPDDEAALGQMIEQMKQTIETQERAYRGAEAKSELLSMVQRLGDRLRAQPWLTLRSPMPLEPLEPGLVVTLALDLEEE